MRTPDLNKRLKRLVRRGNAGGCLDPDQYMKSYPRILWVLRETNSLRPGKSLYDFFVRKNKKMTERHIWYTIWQMVGACSNGIHEGKANFRRDHPSKNAHAGLCKVAVTNAKKYPGKSRADMYKVWTAFLREGETFVKEMRILQPDLVICGGTWEMVAGWVGFRHGFRKYPHTPKGPYDQYWALDLKATECRPIFGYEPQHGRVTFFWAGHPSVRGKRQKYYDDTVKGALWALGR